MRRKVVLSPHRRGNSTSVVTLPRKLPVDKKAVLRSKIQDILRGRSRFVIRKVPEAASSRGRDWSGGGRATSNGQQRPTGPPSVKKGEEVKKDRCVCVFLHRSAWGGAFQC